MVGSMARENSCICLMVHQAGTDVIPVDVDMACRNAVPDMVNREVTYETGDFPEELAITMEETVGTTKAGTNMVMELKKRGYVLTGSRKMRIDNTTISSALFSVFLNINPELVTGRGAGLITAGYDRKVQTMKEGIRIREPSGEGPMGTLSRVGELNLATLTGFYIGCVTYDLPIVSDGLVAGATVLAAVRISPDIKGYLLVSHISVEPAGATVLDALDLKPVISMGACLGEDTGVAALFPFLGMVATMYAQMGSSDNIHMDAYEHLL